ncbi:MAG: hypothetical protein HY881_10225 [Deltaproteobacteria bacterium]|nr:hypothetical protein [Deltaproteobacteria bacterium]
MKCPLCNSRKGKRKCLIADGCICSLCCGQTRNEDACQSCSFYKEPGLRRKYNEVPSYTTRQMEANAELQTYSNVIEGAICSFDHQTDNTINDTIAIGIIELLLDRYHFKDEIIKFDSELVQNGFDYVNKAIEKDLSDIPSENIVKVLGVIHFVAKRRTSGRREYLKIINDYVGEHIGPGARVLRGFGNLS